ncbi:MAG TPA: 50S ribosomal protein L18, partial [Bacteroidales bacterium]|nr:50S ribosomal protein L18 [Bacteroidales bacterium]
MATAKHLRRNRIKKGIRNKISGTAERPRLAVYKSNTAIYAQVINDLA